jgi:hypothetical protein
MRYRTHYACRRCSATAASDPVHNKQEPDPGAIDFCYAYNRGEDAAPTRRTIQGRSAAPGAIMNCCNRGYYIIPISPMPLPGAAGAGSSPIMASVVIIRPATEAAFCSATRTTLAGSIIPISIRSPYSSVCAL